MIPIMDKIIEDYLLNEINCFTKNSSPKVGQLLEITTWHLSFLQLLQTSFTEINVEAIKLIQLHLMKNLEISAQLLEITDSDIDQVITKSIELVDSISAMTDPTRTNSH